MWPLKFRSPHECLRIGRLAAQRWAGQGGDLELVATLALPANAINEPACLGDAIGELFADDPRGKVSVVLESAWSPLLLADTGGALLSATEAEALVQHRLSIHHGGLAPSDVRVDYRAGNRFALGYGLAPGLKQALLNAAEQAGLQLAAITPALVWGWQRLKPPPSTGWWVWPEQDRMLLARVEAGRLVALNPAAALTEDATAIERAVQAEAARWGVQSKLCITSVASWLPATQLPTRSQTLTWHSLVGAS